MSYFFITFQRLNFQITDVNEHAPTFEKAEYTYNVAAPLMPNSDLSRYGPQIIVEDLDFSNQNVKFTIFPDDFNIATIVNEKHYTAVFYTKRVLFLDNPTNYTLTATVSNQLYFILICITV